MRTFFHIVIVVIFSFVTSLVSAQSSRACCPDIDCPMTQCIAMGCDLHQNSVAPTATITVTTFISPLEVPEQKTICFPFVVKKVWIPPD